MTQIDLFSLPISPERLRRAREMRGLTQAELAKASGIDQSHVAFIEAGWRHPSEPVLESLARALKLPQAYFRQPTRAAVPEGTLKYRAKASLTRRVAAQVRREAEHFLEMVCQLGELVNLVPVRLKPIASSPSNAAQNMRSLMQIRPDKPLPHLIRRLEKLGVIVIAVSDHSCFDAFAAWAGKLSEYPIIAIGSPLPIDRVRLTVAHELGHLVLHKNAFVPDKQAETEAFQFAAELLMPASGISRDLSNVGSDITGLLALKQKWGVSVQALARRSNELKIMSDRQYRTFNTRIAKLGWKLEEPSVCDEFTERPLAVRKIAEVAFGNPLPFARMERQLHVPATQLKQFFDRYATEAPPTTAAGRSHKFSSAIH
jgi:Zn-dependent peptidase ImmA (M78 family)/DNA-binding XRE family transcriptional regulator